MEKAGCPCIWLIYYIYVKSTIRSDNKLLTRAMYMVLFCLFGVYRPTRYFHSYGDVYTLHNITYINVLFVTMCLIPIISDVIISVFIICNIKNPKKIAVVGIIYVKLKKKTRKLSSKALSLSFYLQELYEINNVSYIVTLNNNKWYILRHKCEVHFTMTS